MKKFFSNIYAILAGIIALLFGMFMWQKSKKEDAESKLANAETNSDSKVIDTKLDNNKAKMEELNKQNEEAKKATKDQSDSEVADFFKNRK